MPIDKFGQHILHNHIQKYIQPKFFQCVLFIHGKDKGSQIYQEPFYTFMLENNSTVYKVPIREGIIENVICYPENIQYHLNKSFQKDIKHLSGTKISYEDTFVFDSVRKYPNEKLFIQLTVKCNEFN